MRYELDEDGYVKNVYFNCSTGQCSVYEGNIPSGYNSLEEWSENANIQAFKIEEGNLVYDSVRYNQLEQEYNIQCGLLDNNLNFVLCCSLFQGGVASITPTKKKTLTSLNITFTKEFQTIPIVLLTPTSQLTCFFVSNISKTGMTINIMADDTNIAQIEWLAIGKN